MRPTTRLQPARAVKRRLREGASGGATPQRRCSAIGAQKQENRSGSTGPAFSGAEPVPGLSGSALPRNLTARGWHRPPPPAPACSEASPALFVPNFRQASNTAARNRDADVSHPPQRSLASVIETRVISSPCGVILSDCLQLERVTFMAALKLAPWIDSARLSLP